MADLKNQIGLFIERVNRKPFWFLFFLVLLNVILKFFQLSDSSIWLDEAHTASQSLKTISEIISDSANDQNPPFYFIVMHYWVKIFGISEFGLRSFSAFLSTVTVILIFLFARKNMNISTAIISSVLFTFSDQQIYFSIEARTYAFVGFLCMISFMIFCDLIKNPTYLKAGLLGIVNAIMIYSHFISCFVVAVQSVYVLIFFIKDKKKLIVFEVSSLLVTFLFFIPWISNLRKSMPKLGEYWLQKPTFYNFKGLFISFSNGKIMTILFAIIILGAVIFSTKRFKKNSNLDEKHFAGMLLLLWFLFPVISDYLLSNLTPIFLNKYLLYCSIGLYLLIGYSLTELPFTLPRKLLICFVLLICFIASTHLKVNKPENWRATVEYTKSVINPNDAIVLSPAYINLPFLYYYDNAVFRDYKNRDSIMETKKIYAVNEIKTEDLRKFANQERIIFIMSHSTKEVNSFKRIQENFHFVKNLQFGDVNLFILDK